MAVMRSTEFVNSLKPAEQALNLWPFSHLRLKESGYATDQLAYDNPPRHVTVRLVGHTGRMHSMEHIEFYPQGQAEPLLWKIGSRHVEGLASLAGVQLALEATALETQRSKDHPRQFRLHRLLGVEQPLVLGRSKPGATGYIQGRAVSSTADILVVETPQDGKVEIANRYRSYQRVLRSDLIPHAHYAIPYGSCVRVRGVVQGVATESGRFHFFAAAKGQSGWVLNH